jgi:hypothetical protein
MATKQIAFINNKHNVNEYRYPLPAPIDLSEKNILTTSTTLKESKPTKKNNLKSNIVTYLSYFTVFLIALGVIFCVKTVITNYYKKISLRKEIQELDKYIKELNRTLIKNANKRDDLVQYFKQLPTGTYLKNITSQVEGLEKILEEYTILLSKIIEEDHIDNVDVSNSNLALTLENTITAINNSITTYNKQLSDETKKLQITKLEKLRELHKKKLLYQRILESCILLEQNFNKKPLEEENLYSNWLDQLTIYFQLNKEISSKVLLEKYSKSRKLNLQECLDISKQISSTYIKDVYNPFLFKIK